MSTMKAKFSRLVRTPFALLVAMLLLAWCPQARVQASVLITEFMAVNDSTLKDDLGAYSDWIEIYNDGSEPVNLDGYYLTDDLGQLTQWRFPATNLPPRRFLLVFASGLDRRSPGAPLHATFKLSSSGESLALVKPDRMTVLSQYVFGPQTSGVSLGLAFETPNRASLLPTGMVASVWVPTAAISPAWVNIDFDASSWLRSAPAIGFETTTPATASLREFIGTDIQGQMFNKQPGAYLRIPFTLADPSALGDVRLSVRYDDGLVAYLNGTEVGRRNTPADVRFNSTSSTNARPNALAIIPEEIFPIASLASLLKPGTNVLAFQGLNRLKADSDFLISPQLTSSDLIVHPDLGRVFGVPTPGAANSGGLPGTAGDVLFSKESGSFTGSFQLTLTPATPTPTGVIRYTLDRSVPKESSPLYAGPLNITNTAQIRARMFEQGKYPGPTKTGSYLLLNANVTGFTSDLPLIVMHTMGGGGINGDKETVCHLEVHDTLRGRSSLTGPTEFVTRATAKQRGSSTAGNAKKAMAIEFWDEDNGPRDLSPRGMPAESDWILYAVNDQEPVLIHNPYAYDLANQMGRYAPRTRFVELYLNETGGPVNAAHYFGIYVLTEKIKIGPSRVDIDRLESSDNTPPAVTGGYLFKIDRRDPGDDGFAVLGLSAGAGSLGACYVDPKESLIKLPERDPQEKYVASFFRDFDAAISAPNFGNPTNGYAKHLDVEAAIDFHLLNTLTFSVDGEILSTFFHKGRNGKLTFGPPWDFDRSMGSRDSGFERDKSPLVWATQNYFFHLGWWDRLFNDPNFWQRYIDRYQELRRGPFSNSQLVERVDHFVAMVREAQVREVARWPSFTIPRNILLTGEGGYRFDFRNRGYQGEVDQMKYWLSERVRFMDGNFVAPPLFSAPGGKIPPGFRLSMTGGSGSTIHYTLDGTDPRLPGGAINPKAMIYSGPILLNRNARVSARCRNASWKSPTGGLNPPLTSLWSGYLAETYSVETPPLVVTEIMYHPSAPATGSPYAAEDFEFVEVKNVGATALALNGFRITRTPVAPKDFRALRGIEFTFPSITLDPGQYVVVVRNRAAFLSRYGLSPAIAGEFTGNLDDNTDRLIVLGPLQEPILDFEYDSDWYPMTDGCGFSLVAVDETSVQGWGTKQNWRSSAAQNGTPGAANPPTIEVPAIVINELLTASPQGSEDAVELFNPTSLPVSLGGWYLTDDRDVPRKYQIRSDQVIPAGGYLVLQEASFNPNPGVGTSFALQASGEEVFLFSADLSGALTGYRTGLRFRAAEDGVTFGRYEVNPVLAPGEVDYPAQLTNTLGQSNSGPKIGPVVISEIMYHPPDVFANKAYWDAPEFEYVELRNITDQAIRLFDTSSPSNTWQLRSSKQFEFPPQVTLAANGSLLLVNFDPMRDLDQLAAFKTRYSLSADAQFIGPISGKLDNSSEDLKLVRPVFSTGGTNDTVRYITLDRVRYSDSAPWPLGSDGIGLSLQRIRLNGYGNDPGNWLSAAPTPGKSNIPPGPPPTITRHPGSVTLGGGLSVTFSALGQGVGTIRYQWLFNGQVLHGQTARTLHLLAIGLEDAGDYSVVVSDDNSFAISAPGRLTVLEPARITSAPSSQTVNGGTNVTFRVVAQGRGVLRYRWEFNGNPIVGATNDVLTLSKVGLRDDGAYRVIVTDDVGSAISLPAFLSVWVKPVVTLQPQPILAVEGETVTFYFGAYGTPPFTSVWRRDNTVLGATLTNPAPVVLHTLTLPNVQASQAGLYSVKYGSPAQSQGFSSFARLTVLPDADRDGMADTWELAHQLLPTDGLDGSRDADGDRFTNLEEYMADTDPQLASSRLALLSWAVVDGHARGTFMASSNRTYSLQFRERIDRGPWTTLTNIPIRSSNRLESVTDPYPASTPRWYRLVCPLQPRSEAGPIILSSPKSLSVAVGDEAILSVVAGGTGRITYQWLFNDSIMLGETESTLRLPAVQNASQGTYSVIARDDFGSVTSGPVMLTVGPRP